MRRDDRKHARTVLARLVAAVEAGELTAGPVMLAGLRGSVAALDGLTSHPRIH